MSLKLVKPSKDHEQEWRSFINEMETLGEKITPLALKMGTTDFDEYLLKVHNQSCGIGLKEGIVPSDVFFLVDDAKRLLGAIDIRYTLTDYLLQFGGNIGYGVRPSERRKGYASEMLRLALHICLDKGLDKVLVTCYKTNIASSKTILKNRGVLANEVIENDEIKLRYWIYL